MGIVDIHVHIQPWQQLHAAVRATMQSSKADSKQVIRFIDDPGAFVAYLDQIQVERVGLINYPSQDVMGFTEEVNEFVTQYRQHAPLRFIAFGGIHPRLCKNPRERLQHIIHDLKIDAIKIHPPHQLVRANGYVDGSAPALAEIYAQAQENNIPIMIHTGTSIFPGARNRFVHALDIDDIGIDFPNCKIILAHLGRPIEMDEVFFLMRRHKNFYADCSGIPPKKLLEYFPRLEELADRILFGTDWPSPGVRSIEENIRDFQALPLKAETKQKILELNANKLFDK